MILLYWTTDDLQAKRHDSDHSVKALQVNVTEPGADRRECRNAIESVAGEGDQKRKTIT